MFSSEGNHRHQKKFKELQMKGIKEGNVVSFPISYPSKSCPLTRGSVPAGQIRPGSSYPTRVNSRVGSDPIQIEGSDPGQRPGRIRWPGSDLTRPGSDPTHFFLKFSIFFSIFIFSSIYYYYFKFFLQYMYISEFSMSIFIFTLCMDKFD